MKLLGYSLFVLYAKNVCASNGYDSPTGSDTASDYGISRSLREGREPNDNDLVATEFGRNLKQYMEENLGAKNVNTVFEGDLIPTYAQIVEFYGRTVATQLQDAGFVFQTPSRGDAAGDRAIRINARWDIRVNDLVQIPYTFSDRITATSDPSTTKIRAALDVIEQRSKVVKFVPRTTETDYIRVVDGTGCSSFVGRVGNGRQDLSLKTCQPGGGGCCFPTGTIQHEFLHAMGFWHEQSRPDRDTYIRLNEDNILPKNFFNFPIAAEAQSLGTPYDYGSVMHYSSTAFSINGQPTIETINPPGSAIGNREGPSDTDILQVQLLYQCISGARNFSDFQASPCTTDCKCWEGQTGCNGNNDACQGSLICSNNICASNAPPTPAPTPTPAPSNDACNNAMSLSINTPVTGSTLFANQDNAGDCVTSNTAPGVWYKFTGTGTPVEVSTCLSAGGSNSYDTKISVFTGSCMFLTCVSGNDDTCNLLSTVSWAAAQGVEYLILVHGYDDEKGDFTIQASQIASVPEDPPPPPPTGGVPVNDMCADAISLQIDSSLVQPGFTTGATFDDVGLCGDSNPTGPGVWYSVVGNGNLLLAETCSFADYDTQLSVFSGSCENLICEGGNDDQCVELLSQVSWESQSGVTYYILVHGYELEEGEFKIMIDELPSEVNDVCGQATPVQLNTAIDGSTIRATKDNLSDCGTEITAPGVWYTLMGTGGRMMTSTCFFFNFDTQISVFSGSCTNPICVDGNDDTAISSDVCSELMWDTQVGVTYYIFVHGYFDEKGDFSLITFEETPSTPPPTPVATPTRRPGGSGPENMYLDIISQLVSVLSQILGIIPDILSAVLTIFGMN